ncbi:uncharacterized protein DDB_G0271670 [Drosophila nasuta]|uniref:uncharacterized protein DDB_G0271670 n=1 Tax=Drosophila nasuta TaxID=42062 RepID=UPI00295F4C6D|nr:uncharacterized protein DDB_G0271670 [Drosophila nasuta]
METKNPPTVTSSYHHQRAPRTPESYFNVPESVALLNIVKSERIQSAFQSNRKNHASVWEMVAEVLNRFSARKRTAKQCCNRYENLKKIYTQLKKNPERHVRRNWPYMFLFKEIEEQRGECWGSNGKRLALISKNHNELSYYQRRRQAAELGVLLNKDNLTPHQHNLLQSLSHAAHSTDSSQSGASKLERFLPNHFVETQLNEAPVGMPGLPSQVGCYDDNPLQLQVAGAVAAAAAAAAVAAQLQGNPSTALNEEEPQHNQHNHNHNHSHNHSHNLSHSHSHNLSHNQNHSAAFKDHEPPEAPDYDKDCNGALNLHHNNSSTTNDNNISMNLACRSEPLSEGEFNPDDIQLMQTNYNGAQNFYSPSIDQNILHPDVIVDTDNLSDCSSSASLKSIDNKRKLSTSTDGDSTNYELIEYLKRREKRDEELLKRMDAREERLMQLLERTVMAIETLAAGKAAMSSSVSVNASTTTTSSSSSSSAASSSSCTATTVAPLKEAPASQAPAPALTSQSAVAVDVDMEPIDADADEDEADPDAVVVVPDDNNDDTTQQNEQEQATET